MTISDLVGLLGVLCLVAAYFLLQTQRLTSRDMLYPFLNFVGSGLILISLFWAWNLSAVVIEIVWMVISLYGMWDIRRKRPQA